MSHFYARVSFIIGLALGILLAVYLKRSTTAHHKHRDPKTNIKWTSLNYTRRLLSWDNLRYTNETFYTESQYLFQKIKLLCIILVDNPKYLAASNDTWAKGCNAITPVFLEPRKVMPIKQVAQTSSWEVLCNLLNDLDTKSFNWVLIVRDTTFVVTENFRYYVSQLDSRQGYYVGYAKKFWNTIYNSAYPGYALNQASVKMFQREVGKKECKRNTYHNKEDFNLGKHLARLNITPINTIDEEGFSTFFPYDWYHIFNPGENYYDGSVFPVKCCGKRSIAFKATEGDKMYTFNYLFYKLQVFDGGQNGNKPFIDIIPEDEVWKQFLKEKNMKNINISSEDYYRLWVDHINDPESFARNIAKENFIEENAV